MRICSRETHCCYIRDPQTGQYNICQHLVSNQVAPLFSCGLFLKHGNWDDVLTDPEYPGEAWAPGVNCRDWPNGPGVNRSRCHCIGSQVED